VVAEEEDRVVVAAGVAVVGVVMLEALRNETRVT
jgi:hypothetical protein